MPENETQYDPNTCGLCHEPITPQDRARAPHMSPTSNLHVECALRGVIGGINHLRGLCGCFTAGSTIPPDPPNVTAREASRLAWDWWRIPQNRKAYERLAAMRLLHN